VVRPVLVLLALAACGHHGDPLSPDSSTASGDAASGDDAAGADAAVAADAALAIDAAPPPLAVAGTCTYIDQPGWESCPVGMACECYYHYYKNFQNQPGELDVHLAPSELDVLGGTLPSNHTFGYVTPAMIPLTASPTQTGTVSPYTVTVSATGTITIALYAYGGYIPPKDVIYSSADCGNQGQILQCTFTQ
jgi:hypothetical protein